MRGRSHKIRPFLKQLVTEKGVQSRLYTLGSLLLLAVLLTLGVTLAARSWYSIQTTILNFFNGFRHDQAFFVELVDEFPEVTVPPMPGEQVPKSVGAENRGEIDAFVRLLVLPVLVASDGTLLPAKLGPTSDPDAHIIALDLNEFDGTTGDWRYGGDGYWYYLHKLGPGENTDTLGKNLFNTVMLSPTLDDKYKNAQLVIEVKMEAVETSRKNYRVGWWGNNVPQTVEPLKTIDEILSALP